MREEPHHVVVVVVDGQPRDRDALAARVPRAIGPPACSCRTPRVRGSGRAVAGPRHAGCRSAGHGRPAIGWEPEDGTWCRVSAAWVWRCVPTYRGRAARVAAAARRPSRRGGPFRRRRHRCGVGHRGARRRSRPRWPDGPPDRGPSPVRSRAATSAGSPCSRRSGIGWEVIRRNWATTCSPRAAFEGGVPGQRAEQRRAKGIHVRRRRRHRALEHFRRGERR